MKIFLPPEGQSAWTLETDRGIFFSNKFQETLLNQISSAEQGMTFMFCQSVVKAAQAVIAKSKASFNIYTGARASGPNPTTEGSLAQTSSSNRTLAPRLNMRLE